MVLIWALLLQAASAAPAITLTEAIAMSPSELGDRLLTGQQHGPIVHAQVNGGAMMPRSESVYIVSLTERMVPFDAKTCRSHIYVIDMESDNPTVNPFRQPVATHPGRIKQYDRLWIPPSGVATVASCAAAPAKESGFEGGGLGLEQAATLVDQARMAFMLDKSSRLTVKCRSENHTCGGNPRKTLSAIDWNSLGWIEQVKPDGNIYASDGPQSVNASWGPEYVKYTFPYAARGATWEVTVRRTPQIVAVQMEAIMAVYH